MLKGKEFGKAIDAAITLKISSGGARSKAEIARHFGIQPPSLSDWVKKGSIAKERLSDLWAYFSDVAGPEHWGMTLSEWPAGLSSSAIQNNARSSPKEATSWPFKNSTQQRIQALSTTQRHKLDEVMDAVLKGFEAERK